jgi:hypothetical protein
MLLALLLHLIQHVAYGYSLDAVVSPESFLQGVTIAMLIRLSGAAQAYLPREAPARHP